MFRPQAGSLTILSLFLISICRAQIPEAFQVSNQQELRQFLALGRPRDIAWAAYTIAQQNRREMIPNLTVLVASYQRDGAPEESSTVPPEDAAIEAVADALIQLGANLPAATVMRLYPQFPAQTMILLSRASDNNASLLDIFQTTQSRDLWLTAGDLLALHPSREFVYSLLDGFVASFIFRVVPSSDATDTPEFGEGCAGDFWMTADQLFQDWPKARMYRLITSDDHPPNTFAPGLHPVGFTFWATTDYRDPWTDNDCSRVKSEYWRTGLLAEVQGHEVDDFPLEPETRETIRYTTAGLFESGVKHTIEEQSNVFKTILDSFVGGGSLSLQDASTLKLKCRIQIQDERPWPRIPLPAIEGKWCTPAAAKPAGFEMPE